MICSKTVFARGLRQTEQGKWIYSPGAEGKGPNKSTVTRWGQAGNLVLTQGKMKQVMVEQSLAKINSAQGHRTDMVAKHAKARGTAIEQPTESLSKTQTDAPSDDDSEDMVATQQVIGEERAGIKAKKLDCENKLIQLKQSIEEGETLYLDEFLADLGKQAGGLRTDIDRLIDNLAPQIYGLNQAERNTRIQAEINKLLQKI